MKEFHKEDSREAKRERAAVGDGGAENPAGGTAHRLRRARGEGMSRGPEDATARGAMPRERSSCQQGSCANHLCLLCLLHLFSKPTEARRAVVEEGRWRTAIAAHVFRSLTG